MRDEDFLALQQAKREKKKLKKLGRTEEDGTADASAPADEQKSAVVAAPAAEPNDPGLTPKKKRERDVAGSSTTESGSQPSGLVDKTITCIDCSSDFIFSAAEQQFFLDQQWTGGKSRCKTCTAAKKARFGEAAGKGTAAAKRAASTTCFICGVTGHKSKDCSQATCYNCALPPPTAASPSLPPPLPSPLPSRLPVLRCADLHLVLPLCRWQGRPPVEGLPRASEKPSGGRHVLQIPVRAVHPWSLVPLCARPRFRMTTTNIGPGTGTSY